MTQMAIGIPNKRLYNKLVEQNWHYAAAPYYPLTSAVFELMLNPGNKFHALGGNRKGQYAISINKQWRVCFEWHDSNAHHVEIVDYH